MYVVTSTNMKHCRVMLTVSPGCFYALEDVTADCVQQFALEE